MRTSYAWIKQFAGLDRPFAEFCAAMTLSGSKVEEAFVEAEALHGVVVGRIETVEAHPDADRLKIVTVDIGSRVVRMVSAAPNVEAGRFVIAAPAGAVLPDGRKMERASLRGVESDGMLLSVAELGLTTADFPEAAADGLFLLPETSVPGSDIDDVLGLRQEVVDFEITPNRPDCLSVEGLGREAAVTFGVPFSPCRPVVAGASDRKTADLVTVEIESPELCSRFVARAVTDLVIEPSPLWMRRALRSAGIRPINNIVDITNYVMIELGQPLHAYDLRDLDGGALIVRTAAPGETIVTLDSVERELSESTLVIADRRKAVGVAGVMGAENSEIRGDTTTLIFESACFDAASVRRTSLRLGLRSEASARFEKGLSPENSRRALERACELVEQLGAGKVAPDTADVYPRKPEPVDVAFDPEAIRRLLGTDISDAFMVETLERLGFETAGDKAVRRPYYREDVELTVDLAEEVARFYGYNRIVPTLTNGRNTTVGGLSARQLQKEKLIETLLGAGFFETRTMTFENEKTLARMRLTADAAMRLLNPLSEEFTLMRTQLAASLLAVAAMNTARGQHEGRLFEIGRRYLKGDDGQPVEIDTLGLLTFAERDAARDDEFLFVKGAVELVLASLGAGRLTAEETALPYLHPGLAAKLSVDGRTLGYLGAIHPGVARDFAVNENTIVAELDLDVLLDAARTEVQVVEPSRFPSIVRDLAIVASRRVKVADLMAKLETAAGSLLQDLELFDVYEDERLGDGMRSLAFRLTFGDRRRTLADSDLQPALSAVQAMLEAEGLKLR